MLVVFLEPFERRSKDRQVRVHQYRFVCRRRGAVVSRHHHQVVKPASCFIAQAAITCHVVQPLRTAQLVVAAKGVVDRVMEPQREVDFGGGLAGRADESAHLKAFLQMLEVVVGAVRLAVVSNEFFVRFS
ncbi:hypothetical protein D3C84_972680 [compost metagenome]